MKRKYFLVILFLVLAMFLVGCSGSGVTTPPITTNQSPTAFFTISPISGVAPLEVSFDASYSSDPDGTIVGYAWDFKDGNTGSGKTLNHTFSSAGSYNVELTVTDNKGATDTTTKNITITETLPPQEQITPGHMAVIWYDWPQPSSSGFHNFDVLLTIDLDPGVQSDYYWAHSFYFKNEEIGYMGLQTNGYTQGGWVGKMAIFSMWDAIAAEPGPGASCGEFTGEGEGWSCQIKYNWVEGHTYCLRIEACGIDEQENEWWGAWIIDTSSNQETYIGKIKVPGSWQWLDNSSAVWVEYYGQVNDCASTPYAKARFEQPTADNGSFIPQELTSVIGTTCTNAKITLMENQGVIFETGGPL